MPKFEPHIPADPALIVIFGVTGDLSKRKLLPALFNLLHDGKLHPKTQIIGVTRQKVTKSAVLASLRPKQRTELARAFKLMSIDLADAADYRVLKRGLDEIEKKAGLSYQRLYYLSIPPAVLDDVVKFMGLAGLNVLPGGLVPRLLVEKPFGYDLASAEMLIYSLSKVFDETQIYRIDHYLAKEMAQNITDFRFKNALFDSVWSNRHISKVTITAYEQIGIEGRTNFYEQTGALRDLIQSHLLQLMALTAMEKPKPGDATGVHAARLRLLKSVRAPLPYEVVQHARRGQYRTYEQEIGSKSNTETYAALRLFIQNDRWQGVPFVLQTGKHMAEKTTKIELAFGRDSHQNRLEIRLQPDDAVVMDVRVKRPGHDHVVVPSMMDFNYRRSFVSHPAAEAYEKVLLDAAYGDQTLFAGSREVLETWRIVQPVLDEWGKSASDLLIYKNDVKKLPPGLQFV